MVKRYVRDPELRWDTAMKDGDGGQSVISGGIRAVTSADAKQDQLEKEIKEVLNRLLQLARLGGGPGHEHRPRKAAHGGQEGGRLADVQRGVGLPPRPRPGGVAVRGRWRRDADRRCAETQSRRSGDPLPKQLKNFLHEWATTAVPKRWEQFCNEHKDGEPWLDPGDMNTFTRYLRDYLLTDTVFNQLAGATGRS